MLAHQLDLFQDRLPKRPYCTDDLSSGLRIRDQKTALTRRYIQHNPPPLIAYLVYDVDRQGAALAWQDAGLPVPAWVATNPSNGHAHIAYGLVAPICRTESARQQPLRYAAAIESAYRSALRSDRGYSGLITKNPCNESWRVWHPAVNAGYYELAELAEYVTLPDRLPVRDLDAGLGRNVRMFDLLRKWAYRGVRDYWGPGGYERWKEAVRAQADEYNTTPTPLPGSEIRATAKSVAKWVWSQITPTGLQALIERTHTPELQAARGRKSGAARRAGSAEEQRPWDSMGVSRATYYRLKKQGLCG